MLRRRIESTEPNSTIRLIAENQNERIHIDSLPTVIGRGPGVDVVIDDRWASRRNCEIKEVDGAIVVRDLHSRNGTLLNGNHVTESTLRSDDRLTIGMTTLVVEGFSNTAVNQNEPIEQAV